MNSDRCLAALLVVALAKDDTDIWMMDRTATGWSEPKHLGAPVNSEANEWFPTVAASGTLYFGSERPGGKGRVDIWRTRRVDGRYRDPENLGDPINSAASETEPYVSPDERFLILAAASRPDGKGAYDLYVSYNRQGTWTTPENLGEPINSTEWDFSPKMSPDGNYFFFTSSRGFADTPLTKRLTYDELLARLHRSGNGLRDIYQVDIRVRIEVTSRRTHVSNIDSRRRSRAPARAADGAGAREPESFDPGRQGAVRHGQERRGQER